MSVSTTHGSALRALSLEFRSLEQEPVEGFAVNLVNGENLFEWQVAIFGPPNTLYEVSLLLAAGPLLTSSLCQGGYFKVSAPAPSCRTGLTPHVPAVQSEVPTRLPVQSAVAQVPH